MNLLFDGFILLHMLEEQISVSFKSIIKRFCSQLTGLGKKSISYFQKN